MVVDLSDKVLLHVVHSSGYVRRNKEMPQASTVATELSLKVPISPPSPSHRLHSKHIHHFISHRLELRSIETVTITARSPQTSRL
jgi:hypothetical protein